jgi:outer membrane protein TolC
VLALLPELRAQLPAEVDLEVATDRTNSIRASLHEIEMTLLISIALVVLVVSVFLRTLRATIVPAVATVVSLLGTFAVMYLLGFSLNNLSLMALTVATGFVVDDAIVVLENTTRHIEAGMDRMKAALLGAKEVGFTVLSISVSLVAVFIPLLFMQGQVGRLFREFAITLSAAVMISLVISLTTTPMMCAWLLRPPGDDRPKKRPPGRLARWAEAGFARVLSWYEASLDWALASVWLVLFILVCVIGLNVYLFSAAPKGFFPQQDTGQLQGGLRADQSISSQAMGEKLKQVVAIIHRDPAVATVVGFTGGGRAGGGFMFVTLKPVAERSESGQAVIARLRPQLAQVTGLQIFLNPVQDVRAGGRQSNSTYQYTLKSDSLPDAAPLGDAAGGGDEAGRRADRRRHRPAGQRRRDPGRGRSRQRLAPRPQLGGDRLGPLQRLRPAPGGDDLRRAEPVPRDHGMASALHPGAECARRPVRAGQGRDSGTPPASRSRPPPPPRPPPAARRPPSRQSGARDSSTGNALSNTVTPMVPLAAVARFVERATPTSISHQDGELATTISFNLAEDRTLADATAAIRQAEADIGMPVTVRGSFQGTALAAQQSEGQQTLLILTAIAVIYIVLGILYESLVHPVTVLSTLPSAGVGAVLALLLFRMEFSIIALIGVFLLLGIVKKNAILIIDFALEAERTRGLSAWRRCARRACCASADPDDDPGGGARRAAAGDRLRRGRRAAPAARRGDHRRPDREPAAHPADDAGGLRAARQAAAQRQVARGAAARSRPARGGGAVRCCWHARSRSRLRSCSSPAPSARTTSVRPRRCPVAYKEATTAAGATWLPAAPADAFARGEWWRLFGDEDLNRLAARVEIDNQNVAAAVAAYRQAQAIVREARAARFPTLGLNAERAPHRRPRPGRGQCLPGLARRRLGARPVGQARPRRRERARQRRGERRRSRLGQALGPGRAGDRLLLAARGRCRSRPARQDDRRLRAGSADHAEPLCRGHRAEDRRAAGADPARLDPRRSRRPARRPGALRARDRRPGGRRAGRLQPCRRRLDADRAGGAARRALGAAAASPRHRLGRAPGGRRQRPDRHRALGLLPEPVPRRHARQQPVAARRPAERLGRALVARRLGGADGVRCRRDPLRVEGAEAGLDAAIARYRQTVLTAFQAVEDQLATARSLAEQAELRRQASDAADQTEQQILNRYRAGQVGYTDVVTAQASALSARRALTQVGVNRQVSAIDLIQALGGGWERIETP